MNDATHRTWPRWLLRLTLTLAWATGLVICLMQERDRFAAAPNDQPLWLTAITNASVDSTLLLPLLALAPVFWLKTLRTRDYGEPIAQSEPSWARSVLLSIVCGVVAFAAGTHVGNRTVGAGDHRFGDLPPAYHDEYSYLFQARTFLAGRTSYPSVGPEALFDQMHVLNEGRFASRYFPGAGLWIAPFLAMGDAIAGHHVANALIAALFCLTACRIAGLTAGAVCGLSIGLTPGMAIFSNLLLAHHPGLVGLSVFLFAFFELRRRPGFALAALSGTGLAFAMLCRPMTAAGFALPFGAWLAFKLLKEREGRRSVARACAGYATPLLIALVALGFYNRSITGSMLSTPYQQYTDIYTPNHVYGFNNVERGNQVHAPKRITRYDGWATNLTPRRAADNVLSRLVASFRWTFGLVPTAMLAVIALLFWRCLQLPARLVLASVVSLHVAHIPYWFDGIMHYHYVFESGVLWCLLAGLVAADLQRELNLKVRSRPAAWAVMLVIAAMTSAWTSPPNPFVKGGSLFREPRVESEVNGISFSRLRYAGFRDAIANAPSPGLVLVEHDEADIHLEYVSNTPALDANILFGHAAAYRAAPDSERLFPGRNVYLFDAKTRSFELIRAATE